MIDSVQASHQNPPPIRTVTDFSQIGERFFGRSNSFFLLRDGITELDEEFTVAISLIGRENHNTGKIVVSIVLLREMTNNVRALFIYFTENVEPEVLYFIVEGLVVEEEFGKQTKTLAVQLKRFTINIVIVK